MRPTTPSSAAPSTAFLFPPAWYNATVGKKSRFAKWIFDTFAATPVYISTVNPKTRALVAQNTLRNYGYFNGTVDYEILPEKNPRKAKISYTVRPRNLFRLDSIAYLNFPAMGDSLLRRTFRQRALFSGDPFNVINLDTERTRIYNLFRNAGYYFYKPEYVTFRADTIQRPGFIGSTRPSVKNMWYLLLVCANLPPGLRTGRTILT